VVGGGKAEGPERRGKETWGWRKKKDRASNQILWFRGKKSDDWVLADRERKG